MMKAAIQVFHGLLDFGFHGSDFLNKLLDRFFWEDKICHDSDGTCHSHLVQDDLIAPDLKSKGVAFFHTNR